MNRNNFEYGQYWWVFNSDGHQFHQYLQDEKVNNLSHSTHWKDHDICFGNPDPGLGQEQKCGRAKPVNRISRFPQCKKL